MTENLPATTSNDTTGSDATPPTAQPKLFESRRDLSTDTSVTGEVTGYTVVGGRGRAVAKGTFNARTSAERAAHERIRRLLKG